MRFVRTTWDRIRPSQQSLVAHSSPWISRADVKRLNATLQSGNLVRGPVAELLEHSLAKYLEVNHVELYGTGREALVAGLHLLAIRPGDEVIIPTYVCSDVRIAVEDVGAVPRVADVSDSGVIHPQAVERVMSSKTRAILGVHIFGHHCDIQSLKQFGLPVIEDACQAFGVRFRSENNGLAGTIGDISFFSFHPTKLLTGGGGGALVVVNRELCLRASQRALAGAVIISKKSFTDLNASLVMSQLERFPEFIRRRVFIQRKYDSVIDQSLLPHGRDLSSFLYRYTFASVKGFEETKGLFAEKKITVRRGVDRLLHRDLGLRDSDFPNSVRVFDSNVSIPFYPNLRNREVARVMETLKDVVDGT